MALVTLLTLEIALQAFYYVKVGDFLFSRFAQPMYAPNAASTYRLRPSYALRHRTSEFAYDVIINAQGFRVADSKTEYAIPKPEGVYRVMLLGPSFAFGWGVEFEDGISAVIERAMNEANYGNGKRVEVINCGVPGLPPASQLAWFKTEGYKYQPDLVIQIAYGSLAVDPTPLHNVSINPDGYMVLSNVPFRQRALTIAKKSALVYYGFTALKQIRGGSASGAPGGKIQGAGQEMTVEDTFDTEKNERVKTALGYYDDFRTEMESVGAKYLILHFPLSYCIHRGDMARWSHLGVKDVDGQIRFNADFADYLNSIGIPCANITPELIASAATSSDPKDRLYYWLDVHFTKHGNDVAGRAAVDQLTRLVPPPS